MNVIQMLPFIINLVNSVIGVSVLTLPYCFQECGCFLTFFLILGVAYITKLSCDFMAQVAITENRYTYEFAALHVFGKGGKLLVELCMIGVILGNLVAFYVVIGDLGPEILNIVFSIEPTSNVRTILLVLVALFIVIPLALMKDVTSLAKTSAASILFYLILMIHLVLYGLPSFFTGDNLSKLVWWNPSGIFKCIPILAISYSCQLQIFVILNALSEPSVGVMRSITSYSVNIVTVIYSLIGFFGYLAFVGSAPLHGDILAYYPASFISTVIKFGFLLSVAISFPLVIFPCRASLFSLFYLRTIPSQELSRDSVIISEFSWRIITFIIVISTLLLGIMVPNVELVLSLAGSVTGIIVCYILPSALYLGSFTKGQMRKYALLILGFGFIVLILSTVTTLYSMESMTEKPLQTLESNIDQKLIRSSTVFLMSKQKRDVDLGVKSKDGRIEPVNPQEPQDLNKSKDYDAPIVRKEREAIKQQDSTVKTSLLTTNPTSNPITSTWSTPSQSMSSNDNYLTTQSLSTFLKLYKFVFPTSQ